MIMRFPLFRPAFFATGVALINSATGCSSTLNDAPTDAGMPDVAFVDAQPSRDAEANADASAPDATIGTSDAATSDAAIPDLGGCEFNVDGVRYTSMPNDPFTLATQSADELSVQCVAIVGNARYTVNLAAKGVVGPGPSAPGAASYAEQPTMGGGATLFRNFATPINVASLSATAVAGNAQFRASGPSTKIVSIAFNLPLK
jgi:hypothetical protein